MLHSFIHSGLNIAVRERERQRESLCFQHVNKRKDYKCDFIFAHPEEAVISAKKRVKLDERSSKHWELETFHSKKLGKYTYKQGNNRVVRCCPAFPRYQLTSARSNVPLVQRTMERTVNTIFRRANWKEPSLSRKSVRLELEQRKLVNCICWWYKLVKLLNTF